MSDQSKQCGLSLGKRKREPTFTNNEKQNLITLVERHFSVIECKKTDALSSKAKHNEWLKIALEFNSMTDYIPRDMLSLKTLWDNLKKKAKQTMTAINNNRYATGGGPSKEPKEDPNIDKVMSLIKTNVEGFSNIYDSDYTLDNTGDCNKGVLSPPTPLGIDNSVYEHSYNQEFASEVPVHTSWSKYTPSQLRTPRTKVLVEDVVHYETVEEEMAKEETLVTLADQHRSTAASPTAPESSRNRLLADRLKNSATSSKSTRHLASRRRPVLKQSEAVALASKKIETLKCTVEQSKEQHDAVMRCLLLQEQQEEEKLKQEKEKTEQEIIKKKYC